MQNNNNTILKQKTTSTKFTTKLDCLPWPAATPTSELVELTNNGIPVLFTIQYRAYIATVLVPTRFTLQTRSQINCDANRYEKRQSCTFLETKIGSHWLLYIKILKTNLNKGKTNSETPKSIFQVSENIPSFPGIGLECPIAIYKRSGYNFICSGSF